MTDAAEGGDDLVEDQQDAVSGAEFTQALQIARRRHDHPRRSGHRFDDHRGDAVRPVQLHHAHQVVGQMPTPLGLTAAEGAVLVIQGVAQVIDPLQLRTECPAVAPQTTDADAAETGSVVALVATDQSHGIGEEHPVEPPGCHGAEAAGETEGLGMADLEGHRVVQLGGLALHGGDHVRMAVPRVHAPQTRGPIEQLAAILGAVVHAAGAGDQARRLAKPAIGSEGHPVGVQIERPAGSRRGAGFSKASHPRPSTHP